MVLLFMNSVVGYVLVHRILADLAEEFAFTQQIFTILAASSIGLFLFLTFACASSLTLWIFIGILLITLKFFPNILRVFLLRRLFLSLIPLLDHVVLGLQSGKSFRSSLMSAIELQNGWVRNQLRDLYSSMVMSETHVVLKSALLKDFREEMCEIDRSQNRLTDQVRALRQLKLQQDFRRRSGQVTQQIKMQAIIVTALYLGLLGFVILQFGWREHMKLIMSSSVLFFLGLIIIFQVGRRMTWKV